MVLINKYSFLQKTKINSERKKELERLGNLFIHRLFVKNIKKIWLEIKRNDEIVKQFKKDKVKRSIEYWRYIILMLKQNFQKKIEKFNNEISQIKGQTHMIKYFKLLKNRVDKRLFKLNLESKN